MATIIENGTPVAPCPLPSRRPEDGKEEMMKRHSKKLQLNRETIAALSQDHLAGVVGGAITAQCTKNPAGCARSDIPWCGPAVQTNNC